jgi:HEAT repeat protein
MNAFRFLLPAWVMLGWAGCAAIPGNPAAEARLAVLASDAGLQEKAQACHELAVVGGPESVPALAQLLDHEHLADYARSGLEAIAHPSAGEALRASLRTLQGRNLAGAINSLGVRRDTASVPELTRLTLDPNPLVAEAAINSLGMIGTAGATQTLLKMVQSGPEGLRVPATHAALVAAEHMSRSGQQDAARNLLHEVSRAQLDDGLRSVVQNQLAILSR